MTNEKLPKAWLPADSFEKETESKYLEVFADLIDTGSPLRFKIYNMGKSSYELSAEGSVVTSKGAAPEVEISIQATKRFQQKADPKQLMARNFKRYHPTSTKWVKVMPGHPAPHMVSNHLFSGISHLVGFDNSTGFTIVAENSEDKEIFTKILSKHSSIQDEIDKSVTHF